MTSHIHHIDTQGAPSLTSVEREMPKAEGEVNHSFKA